MRFTETTIRGVLEIRPEVYEDERGFFARTWCQREFEEHGLDSRIVQCSISFNRRKGTLRGMHFQVAPHGEAKLVRCTAGSIYDVAIDLRPESPTFLQHISAVLTGASHNALYIPPGCAHGFQTLEENTEVLYQMSEFYAGDCARGVRWDDPVFAIQWPEDTRTILERDRSYPDFTPEVLAPRPLAAPATHV